MKGQFIMVIYEPLWNTMKEKGITKYQLIYHWGISSNTLRRMSHNEPISTTTLNELCLILDCQVQDILCYSPTGEEIQKITTKKAALQEKYKRKSSQWQIMEHLCDAKVNVAGNYRTCPIGFEWFIMNIPYFKKRLHLPTQTQPFILI